MTLGLYRYQHYFGRMGDLEGIFLADSEEVSQAIGREVYFGEALGKHSEIYHLLTEKDITLITDDLVVLDLVEKYNLHTGYNPLHYITEDSSENDEE